MAVTGQRVTDDRHQHLSRTSFSCTTTKPEKNVDRKIKLTNTHHTKCSLSSNDGMTKPNKQATPFNENIGKLKPKISSASEAKQTTSFQTAQTENSNTSQQPLQTPNSAVKLATPTRSQTMTEVKNNKIMTTETKEPHSHSQKHNSSMIDNSASKTDSNRSTQLPPSHTSAKTTTSTAILNSPTLPCMTSHTFDTTTAKPEKQPHTPYEQVHGKIYIALGDKERDIAKRRENYSRDLSIIQCFATRPSPPGFTTIKLIPGQFLYDYLRAMEEICKLEPADLLEEIRHKELNLSNDDITIALTATSPTPLPVTGEVSPTLTLQVQSQVSGDNDVERPTSNQSQTITPKILHSDKKLVQVQQLFSFPKPEVSTKAMSKLQLFLKTLYLTEQVFTITCINLLRAFHTTSTFPAISYSTTSHIRPLSHKQLIRPEPWPPPVIN